MDDQPTLNAVHEAGHVLIAYYVSMRSMIATAKPGEDLRGKWLGRVIYDPAALKLLDPHQRTMSAVAGSIAGLIAQGLTPTFEAVRDSMSGRDLEYCRVCGQEAFGLAVEEVAAILGDPGTSPHLIEIASRLDAEKFLVSGKFDTEPGASTA